MEQNQTNAGFDRQPVRQTAQQPAQTAPANGKTAKIITGVIAGVVAVIAFLSGIAVGRGSSGAKAASQTNGSASSYSGRSDSGSGYSGSASSDEMSHSTYCRLYMSITDVQVKHERNYTYVSGKVTNNGTYSIKYVKVKASCKDYSGNVIDTDWTYAVDSAWLEPGESKTFQMMIRDESGSIKTATVTFME